MSFLAKANSAPWYEGGLRTVDKVDPIARAGNNWIASAFTKKPPTPPQVPNPNDAANAAQSLTDQMRMRRGVLANIYAGSQSGAGSQPVTGKTALGT